jgi:hypothetical protein
MRVLAFIRLPVFILNQQKSYLSLPLCLNAAEVWRNARLLDFKEGQSRMKVADRAGNALPVCVLILCHLDVIRKAGPQTDSGIVTSIKTKKPARTQ